MISGGRIPAAVEILVEDTCGLENYYFHYPAFM